MNFDYDAIRRLESFAGIERDDCIYGTYNDLKMEVSELKTYYWTTQRSSKGSTSKSKHYTFKGVVLSADIAKPFKGITAISHGMVDENRIIHPSDHHCHRGDGNSINLNDIGGIIDTIGTVAKVVDTVKEEKAKYDENPEAYMQEAQAKEQEEKNLKISQVHLEDPMFEKKFKAFSTDQIEARYLFTTAFINRFMKIAQKYNFKVKAVFYNQRMFLMINRHKNWFEIPFTKPADRISTYKTIMAEFSGLLAVIDTLKLEQNIGM